jgi:hypothetical protein
MVARAVPGLTAVIYLRMRFVSEPLSFETVNARRTKTALEI